MCVPVPSTECTRQPVWTATPMDFGLITHIFMTGYQTGLSRFTMYLISITGSINGHISYTVYWYLNEPKLKQRIFSNLIISYSIQKFYLEKL